jgi:hypothetical protein
LRPTAYAQKPTFKVFQPFSKSKSEPSNIKRLLDKLDINSTSPENFAASLPFSINDTTVGVENELQAAVVGPQEYVDFPLTIRGSNYYKNILRNTETGSTSQIVINTLEDYLSSNHEGIWENNWVRLPQKTLCHYARQLLTEDLRADKSNPGSPVRTDACRFSFRQNDEQFYRIPVSYLLKLALADAIGDPHTDQLVQEIGEDLLDHFLNDNTSPEVFSFYPAPLAVADRIGQRPAGETASRYKGCCFYLHRAFDKPDRDYSSFPNSLFSDVYNSVPIRPL